MKTKIGYCGFIIKRSRDFGTRGNKGRGALVVVDPRFNTNVTPGGGWYSNTKDALDGINIMLSLGYQVGDLLNKGFDAMEFHKLYRERGAAK